MECKFLNHGIALAYQETVKPCCVWTFNQEYKQRHQIQKINFQDWHKNSDIVKAKDLLSMNVWPENCKHCEKIENQGRHDSMRLNGLNAYNNFNEDEITLEIRPGSVCNFACQTCWPAASSRVHQYHKQAKLLDTNINNKKISSSIDIDKSIGMQNFDYLNSIKDRIKTIILLGGEPFYDKNCLKFFDWWNENTAAELIIFTNGSCIDVSQLKKFKNSTKLVFSLDAIEKPAEYIRFGTNWPQVWENYKSTTELSNIETRVNITTSVYNFYYLNDLIKLLVSDWPKVVSFGPVFEKHLTECVVPVYFRGAIIERLVSSIELLEVSNIEDGQKSNAVNSLKSIIYNLETVAFDKVQYHTFKTFVKKMDSVKKINIANYCEFTSKLLIE